jgi:hypothetical protein
MEFPIRVCKVIVMNSHEKESQVSKVILLVCLHIFSQNLKTTFFITFKDLYFDA